MWVHVAEKSSQSARRNAFPKAKPATAARGKMPSAARGLIRSGDHGQSAFQPTTDIAQAIARQQLGWNEFSSAVAACFRNMFSPTYSRERFSQLTDKFCKMLSNELILQTAS